MKSNPLQALRLICTACALTALAFSGTGALASSHREAPAITELPKADATDLYMFRSYETGRAGYVTILANYMPLQDPPGGTNFFMFDADALYEINIDNNGDAKEDISFKFRFKNTSKGAALTVGGQQTKIALIQSGVIDGVNSAALNVRETFSVEVARGGRRTAAAGKLTNVSGGASEFDKPVDNIGEKTFGSPTGCETYANQHFYNVAIPGCGNGKMFVGQRKEPF